MWKKIKCSKADIQLMFTLCGGQCFRWKNTGDGEWTGVFARRIWTLSQNDECIMYKVVNPKHCEPSASNKTVPSSKISNKPQKSRKRNSAGEMTTMSNDVLDEDEALLRKYLRLDVNLPQYYEAWSKKDPNFKEAAVKFSGVRILDQDPTENLFSFICSSNNNIARISSMVEKLCSFYGDPLGEVKGVTYYDFPPVSALTHPSVEHRLRTAGFGYRAKFIHQSACMIVEEGGSNWLHSLKSLPYQEAKTELMRLHGIGAKVADCICLMSLGHLESIPVDTHIFQVAVSRYLPHLKACKSVTDKVYSEIGDHFRDLYGPLAGWAHTILFCADLKMFQDKPTKETAKLPDKPTPNKSVKRKKK